MTIAVDLGEIDVFQDLLDDIGGMIQAHEHGRFATVDQVMARVREIYERFTEDDGDDQAAQGPHPGQ